MVIIALLSIIEFVIAILTIIFIWRSIKYIIQTNRRIDSYKQLSLCDKDKKEIRKMKIKTNSFLILSYLLILLFIGVIASCIYIVIMYINS